jgi:inner membrane protein
MMKHPLVKKVMVIVLLSVLLMIPLMMIEDVVKERSSYREEARYSIAQSWTGEQQVLGPLLVVPYKERFTVKQWNKEAKRYEEEERVLDRRLLIAPEGLTVDGEVATETRKRGIYEVPVYRSQLAVTGSFDLSGIDEVATRTEHQIEWQEAVLSVSISDTRGVEVQPVLKWRNQTIQFKPDTLVDGIRNGMHANLGQLQAQGGLAEFSFDLHLNGMEMLSFAPMGKSTSIRLKADWPDPSFVGRYLPSSREIDLEGFRAKWNLSSFSSGVPRYLENCQEGDCSELAQESFGVRLFNSVDIYQQSERSVKYALMFIGLTFVSFFLYELMKGLRMHPMQYLLVGLGLSVFYLLLISLSEHMAFVFAYCTASLASTLLIGFYVSSVFNSVKHGGILTAELLLLYGTLYGILSAEDSSLLMGSLLIFGVLSLVMVVTRRLDWYEVTDNLTARLSVRKAVDEVGSI